MALGKTIRLHLTDGSSTGPIVAEIINWTGQVVVVPRAQLGFDFLRPTATRDPDAESSTVPLLIMDEVGAMARAKEIDGRFVVLAGSTARRQGTPAWDSYIGLRDSLVDQGKLAPQDDKLFAFTEDVEFSSPSATATVVAAANRNGRTTWRLDDGRTYADWKQVQVETAYGRPAT